MPPAWGIPCLAGHGAAGTAQASIRVHPPIPDRLWRKSRPEGCVVCNHGRQCGTHTGNQSLSAKVRILSIGPALKAADTQVAGYLPALRPSRKVCHVAQRRQRRRAPRGLSRSAVNILTSCCGCCGSVNTAAHSCARASLRRPNTTASCQGCSCTRLSTSAPAAASSPCASAVCIPRRASIHSSP